MCQLQSSIRTYICCFFSGRDTVVGLTNRYGLEGPVFYAPVGGEIHTDAGAQPVSCTVGSASIFRGVERPECGADHPPPSNAGV